MFLRYTTIALGLLVLTIQPAQSAPFDLHFDDGSICHQCTYDVGLEGLKSVKNSEGVELVEHYKGRTVVKSILIGPTVTNTSAFYDQNAIMRQQAAFDEQQSREAQQRQQEYLEQQKQMAAYERALRRQSFFQALGAGMRNYGQEMQMQSQINAAKRLNCTTNYAGRSAYTNCW